MPVPPVPISAANWQKPSASTDNVGDVRGDGLMAGSRVRRGQATTASSSKRRRRSARRSPPPWLERGVIGRAMPQGDILGFAPPLCLTKEEADIVVKAAADAIKSVLG
jgi:L-2,4-diaminobutyrate transaminase